MSENELFKTFLDDWLECNTVCDLGKPSKFKDKKGLEKVDYYMKALPGADYVRSQTLNYIFSNGITTGNLTEDERLDEFLYRRNMMGITNLEVLKNAVALAISHGCCGVRWYESDIYMYRPSTYKALPLRNKDGVLMNAGFIVAEDGKEVPDILFKEEVSEYMEIVEMLRDQKIILLDTKDFLNLRNDTSLPYGYSPLLHDELRLDLLSAVYERLNYDIKYDGPGRIVIRPKSGFYGDEDNDVSTTELMKQSTAASAKRIDDIKKEATRVGQELKKSSSDSVIVLSNAFDKEITHLERVTKATEFFEWIKNEGVILAQDFGMSPSLLELGGISGNVSMTSIIDNAIWNSIVPLREKYAVQFSSFLSQKLGVTKTYFNKYELHQEENQNTMRTQISNIMSILNSINDDSGHTRPKAQQLVDDFADMLSANIHNDKNQLEEL